MKITAKLKAHLLGLGWIKADDSDETIKQVVSAKMAGGEISPQELADLTKDAPPKVDVKKIIGEEVGAAVKEALSPLTEQLTLLVSNNGKDKDDGDNKDKDDGTKDKDDGTKDKDGDNKDKDKDSDKDNKDDDDFDDRVKRVISDLGMDDNHGRVTPMRLLARAASGNVRVKSPLERYEDTKKAALVPSRTMKGSLRADAGMPAKYMGRPLYHPSEKDLAICGAYFKWSIAINTEPKLIPRGLRMTEHEEQIIQHQLREGKWTGIINPSKDQLAGIRVDRRQLEPDEIKALLDDGTSGGLEIDPIEFDDALILTPVLFGELFPQVNVVNLTRGRRVEGGAVSNPTWTSGTAEGTAITPFNTASFVSAFDTTIYPAVGAMEVGEDFLEDSPTNIGQVIVDKYGEKHMEWLDEQIAVGDGTTEPQGVFNAAGTTTVNSDNGVGGPPTVSDYESLMFGVSKAFRNTKGSRNVFIANDTTYRRARGVAVSGTDQRRVFGMTHMDYRLLDHDYKVQGSIGNSQAAFVNLGYYRMYRRLGMTVRIERSGNYLALRNLRLIVVRMRWGGQLELGGAAAVSSDFKA